MTPEAIKAEWMKTMPLGKIEYMSLGGRTASSANGRSAIRRCVKLGDSLFVHGGISSAYANLPVEDINRQVAAALKARDTAPTSIINRSAGPAWYRGLITRDAGDERPSRHRRTVRPRPLPSTQEIDLVLSVSA